MPGDRVFCTTTITPPRHEVNRKAQKSFIVPGRRVLRGRQSPRAARLSRRENLRAAFHPAAAWLPGRCVRCDSAGLFARAAGQEGAVRPLLASPNPACRLLVYLTPAAATTEAPVNA